MLWETYPEDWKNWIPNMAVKTPIITVINETWQREKCAMLGLTFQNICKQPDQLIGEPLYKYQPWETETILGDGNCLFRCLSKIITGNQDSHTRLRKIISNFIASEGITKLGWYFRQFRITPSEYFLTEKAIHLDGVWGGDVEIMVASVILQVDIYVANNNFSNTLQESKFSHQVRWSLLRGSKETNSAIYIQNFEDHYQPVISMINCPTSMFGIIEGSLNSVPVL